MALLKSQRTRRAGNLGAKLKPRAIAVFPSVSKNISPENLAHLELSKQLNYEIEKAGIDQLQPNEALSRSKQIKYRELEKIEVS